MMAHAVWLDDAEIESIDQAHRVAPELFRKAFLARNQHGTIQWTEPDQH
jgi:hypothetical protein